MDEDNVSLVKSPEKKALSPVQSISDIFAKSASSKVAKSRDVTVPERSVSPFAAKRGEEAVKKPPLAGKKLANYMYVLMSINKIPLFFSIQKKNEHLHQIWMARRHQMNWFAGMELVMVRILI